MATFLDTTALIDVTKPDSPRHQWCVEAIDAARAEGPILITDIVFSEFSVGLATLEQTEEIVSSLDLVRYSFDNAALFRAGRAFRQYKDQNQGPKLNVLSDFLIGAQAEIAGAPLITGNARDYQNYFPELELVSPPA